MGKAFPSGFLCRQWPEVVEEELASRFEVRPKVLLCPVNQYCATPSASAEVDLSFS